MTDPHFAQEWQKLYVAIGEAISEWSRLEHALASAFAITLGINEAVAEQVFFSARSFNGKHDMLMAALKARAVHEKHPEHKRFEIFRSGCKKAEKWASARNKLAHERPTVSALGKELIGGVLTPNVLSRDIQTHFQQCMTTEAISESAKSFQALTQAVLLACEQDEETSLDTLLQRVRELPPSPYSDSLERRVTSARAHRQSRPQS
jgi:hypothetical protein